jgi:RNA polymerase sigma-70 factor (ECF subfamily)
MTLARSTAVSMTTDEAGADGSARKFRILRRVAWETSIGGPGAGFQTTLWSTVREAGAGGREAMERLVELYWKPAYFFIRRRGHDVEAAKDLTQSFFATVLEKGYVGQFEAQRGRFRTFLRASLAHFLANERDKAVTLKRGGGLVFTGLEEELASTDRDPERAFQRRWALEVTTRALDRLRAEVSPDDYALVTGGEAPRLTVDERKSRARRMRERLRELLCEELLPTLESRTQLDAEIHDLFESLG